MGVSENQKYPRARVSFKASSKGTIRVPKKGLYIGVLFPELRVPYLGGLINKDPTI